MQSAERDSTNSNGSNSGDGGIGNNIALGGGVAVQRGVNRVLKKLEESIERGDYYEAHQMYRTLYFRYTTQKKFQDCLDLLYNGASKLISKEQQSSAVDLCLLLVDTLEKCEGQTTTNFDSWILKLGHLIRLINANIVDRETLIQRAVKWSGTVCGNNTGYYLLHNLIADMYLKEKNYEMARQHFLLCQDGDLFGVFLAKMQEAKGFRHEIDIFVVQAVLQQLCLKDKNAANNTFNSYIKNHPGILKKRWPYKYPLLNFIYFLLNMIEKKDTSGFRPLKNIYDRHFARDISFLKYLDKIGQIYFDEVPQPAQNNLMSGMFGDLFSRLFQGMNSDDVDSDDNAVNGISAQPTAELD